VAFLSHSEFVLNLNHTFKNRHTFSGTSGKNRHTFSGTSGKNRHTFSEIEETIDCLKLSTLENPTFTDDFNNTNSRG
jgi:hypothetical protein